MLFGKSEKNKKVQNEKSDEIKEFIAKNNLTEVMNGLRTEQIEIEIDKTFSYFKKIINEQVTQIESLNFLKNRINQKVNLSSNDILIFCRFNGNSNNNLKISIFQTKIFLLPVKESKIVTYFSDKKSFLSEIENDLELTDDEFPTNITLLKSPSECNTNNDENESENVIRIDFSNLEKIAA